jgi:hypothetical protein
MIFTTAHGETIDTAKDLTAPERHILQKLFFWKSMAVSVEQFRGKKTEALEKGWNDSGPVTESPAMKKVTQDLEEKVRMRLHRE